MISKLVYTDHLYKYTIKVLSFQNRLEFSPSYDINQIEANEPENIIEIVLAENFYL